MNHRESISMGDLVTFFHAEVLTILKSAELLISNMANRVIVINSDDCRTAMSAIAKITEYSIVQEWERPI